MLEKTGKKSKFINGLRYTDAETMEIVQMVLTGKLNKDIVGLLLQAGGKAVGLSGVDAGLLRAKKIDKDGLDLGFVGDVTEVNPELLTTLLAQGYIPVVSTVAIGETGDMNRYNINADTAAAKIAVALKAEKFVQLTNVPGLLRDVNVQSRGDQGRRSSHVHHRRARASRAFDRDVLRPRHRHDDSLKSPAS
jgi:acetylglutamate kinase